MAVDRLDHKVEILVALRDLRELATDRRHFVIGLEMLPLLQQHGQRGFACVSLWHCRRLLPLQRRARRKAVNGCVAIVVGVADRVIFTVCIEDRLAFVEYVVD